MYILWLNIEYYFLWDLKTYLLITLGFPGGSDGKESACDAGAEGSLPGLGRSPGEGNGFPLQYSCLKDKNGRRSLVGYSPWGGKELDTTDH